MTFHDPPTAQNIPKMGEARDLDATVDTAMSSMMRSMWYCCVVVGRLLGRGGDGGGAQGTAAGSGCGGGKARTHLPRFENFSRRAP